MCASIAAAGGGSTGVYNRKLDPSCVFLFSDCIVIAKRLPKQLLTTALVAAKQQKRKPFELTAKLPLAAVKLIVHSDNERMSPFLPLSCFFLLYLFLFLLHSCFCSFFSSFFSAFLIAFVPLLLPQSSRMYFN
jgi:hypothetical protein